MEGGRGDLCCDLDARSFSGRLLHALQVGEAASFLASGGAASITGQVLFMDGGFSTSAL